jgi:CHAD domain-containing protein
MSHAQPAPTLDPHAPVASNARQILRGRIDELFSFESRIPDATAVEELHDARIAAKRLRYTLEMFQPVFEARSEKLIEQLKLLQEELGQLHDADVRIALIEEELDSLKPGKKPAVREGLEALLAREQAGRAARHESVVKLWRSLKRGRFEARLNALIATD